MLVGSAAWRTSHRGEAEFSGKYCHRPISGDIDTLRCLISFERRVEKNLYVGTRYFHESRGSASRKPHIYVKQINEKSRIFHVDCVSYESYRRYTCLHPGYNMAVRVRLASIYRFSWAIARVMVLLFPLYDRRQRRDSRWLRAAAERKGKCSQTARKKREIDG